MQLAVAIALTIIYFGITLALGGVYPKPDEPWWLFVPVGVTIAGALFAEMMSALAVSGWARDFGYRDPEGSTVPVFYDASNYSNHVVGCACWFEAD